MGFRKDFVWGASTAAYQIEGAYQEDGKGLSIWDQFTHTPGKIFEGHNGDVACDHYHRYAQDAKLMAELGIRNYRFSLSWPRLLPDGRGAINEKGVDFYNRLIDSLLENGVRPFMTLFHWDYPAALQQDGGWANPDSAKWYADYVELAARRFGDRVKDFMTFNEPQIFGGLGHVIGVHAPGLHLPPEESIPLSHNILKAHGLGVQRLREFARDARVGYAPCADPFIPVSDSPADIEAARKAYFDVPEDQWFWSAAWWSDPAILGRYPEVGLRHFERHLPKGWERDMATICQPLDFYAQNIYQGRYVRAAQNEAGYEPVLAKPGHPTMTNGWLIAPDALYWGPKFLYERYKLPLYITENGACCTDVVSLDGAVHDPAREDTLHRYLLSYRRAAEEGVDARGYFVWSFMDTEEWNSGYSLRFGLVHIDFETLKRTPKDSAYWYKQVMESNGENL